METHVKVLRGITIFCQKSGCEQIATHLFRSGGDPIFAYCEAHAETEADHIGVELPMDITKVLHAGW